MAVERPVDGDLAVVARQLAGHFDGFRVAVVFEAPDAIGVVVLPMDDARVAADVGEARPTDIARRLGVSHATAIKTIARLKRAELATSRPYRGVFLTDKGHALAERVRARHRLVVDLLRAVGVPSEAAEADAEGIEHHVSDATLKAFAHFLKSRTGSG